ncbi:MAG: hypothetical protein ACYCPS_04325 [Candidatus Saccharimonadales bacterium]
MLYFANMAEWLSKIDVYTSYYDVVTSPSPFNPYPEYASSGVEVWSRAVYGLNPQYVLRYSQLDAGCQVVLPIDQPQAEDSFQKPGLSIGSELNGGRHQVDVTDSDNWIALPEFWNDLSVKLASEFLREQGQDQNAIDRLSQIISDDPNRFSSLSRSLEPQPRNFVAGTIAAVAEEIEHERPEVAYYMATELFTAIHWLSSDGTRFNNSRTLEWITDGLPQAVFPDFSKAWSHDADPHKISTVSHPHEIGTNLARIISYKLSSYAIEAWETSKSRDYPEEVSDKVRRLREHVATEVLVQLAELRLRLEEATKRYPEVARTHNLREWRKLQSLGGLVMSAFNQ